VCSRQERGCRVLRRVNDDNWLGDIRKAAREQLTDRAVVIMLMLALVVWLFVAAIVVVMMVAAAVMFMAGLLIRRMGDSDMHRMRQARTSAEEAEDQHHVDKAAPHHRPLYPQGWGGL